MVFVSLSTFFITGSMTGMSISVSFFMIWKRGWAGYSMMVRMVPMSPYSSSTTREPCHFVEIELVAGEFGQQVEGQVQVVSREGGGLFGGQLLEGGHGFVAVDAVNLEEMGHQSVLGLHKSGVELGVVVGAVHVEEQHQLSFISESLGDASQSIAFVYGHEREGLLKRRTLEGAPFVVALVGGFSE